MNTAAAQVQLPAFASYAEASEFLAAVQKHTNDLRAAELGNALASVRATITEFSLTAEMIFPGLRTADASPAPVAGSAVKKAQRPKSAYSVGAGTYRAPDGSEYNYIGKRRPQWLTNLAARGAEAVEAAKVKPEGTAPASTGNAETGASSEGAAPAGEAQGEVKLDGVAELETAALPESAAPEGSGTGNVVDFPGTAEVAPETAASTEGQATPASTEAEGKGRKVRRH